MNNPNISIIDAIDDPNLFHPWFKNPESWQAWRVFLSALFALPMERQQAKIFRECTNRKRPPAAPVQEGWMIIGRRGGKSFISALTAVYLACFGDYEKYLTPGETGVIMVICPDRKQARVCMRYISALMNNVALLRPLIAKEMIEGIELTNRISIEVHTASFRTVRGYTVAAAILDELAFFPSEDSASPDDEILAAIRPSMATIPGSLLLCLSSPYARKGALWTAYREHFGKEKVDVLVWQAPSWAVTR